MVPDRTDQSIDEAQSSSLHRYLDGRRSINRGQIAAMLAAVLLACTAVTGTASAGMAAGAVQTAETQVTDFSINKTDRTLVNKRAQHYTAGDFDQENIQLFSEGNPTQNLRVQLEVAGDTGTETLTIDYSEAADAGMKLVDASVGDGPLSGAVTDVSIDSTKQTLTVTFDTSQTGDAKGTQHLTAEWTVSSSGLSPDDGDDSIEYTVTVRGESSEDARFRLVRRGATAIAPGDTAFDLSQSNGPKVENIAYRRDGSSGAFEIWQDQKISFQTPNNGQQIEIKEYETTNRSGEKIIQSGDTVKEIGTAPGAVTNYDTGNLDAGKYIIDFPSTKTVALMRVDPLDLRATPSQPVFNSKWVSIEVSAKDITGGNITAYFFDSDFDRVIHRKDDILSGDGEAVIELNAIRDLEGDGEYGLIVKHDESEVTSSPQKFIVKNTSCIDVNDNGNCATDTTGDDLFNDVNGDRTFSIADVQVFFMNYESDIVTDNPDRFDFSDDGEISIADVQVLFEQYNNQTN